MYSKIKNRILRIYNDNSLFNKIIVLFLLIMCLTTIIISSSFANGISDSEKSYQFDVIIYGGTASGVIAAVAAARAGANVALLEPGSHLGGMVSSGLSVTDVGNEKVIGGLAREFLIRAGSYYNKPISWTYEPHIAEKVFKDMIKEAKVKVFFNHRLKENIGVSKSGTKINKITCENNDIFIGRIYIDCTYEGDLMAQSGTSYTWGREGKSKYNESLAGVRPYSAINNFKYNVSAYSGNRELLPGITGTERGEVGSADFKIQAYTYRLLLTKDPKKRIGFTKPENYRPYKYSLLLNYLKHLKEKDKNHIVSMKDIFSVVYIRKNEIDINSKGPFSTDLIGGSWEYPNADYAKKDKIKKEHKDYIQGMFYFLCNDKRVPKELRLEIKNWGLSKDEFPDNGNWPYQLYIREARRMLGDYVMTQKDIETNLLKYDSIGMGSYNTDSHNAQRYLTSGGFVQNEGDLQIKVNPYQIPYRAILPKENETTNLLVPVCLSASHVAYSSIRMEPQYMILGQAAGIAAKLAIDENTDVSKISIPLLTEKLKASGAILELTK